MLTTAEVRWFWPARCPQLVRDWFFKTGLPPGGGLSRVDRYARHRSGPEITLKKRGRNPDFEVKGFEVKGLVTTRVIQSSNRSLSVSKYGASGLAQFQV